MSKVYDLSETIATLAAVVVAKGEDYVYDSPWSDSGTCYYTHGDEPGCIVGHVLHRLGVTLNQLEEYEFAKASTVIRHLSKDGVIDFTGEATLLLHHVQELQDAKVAWGEALSEALADYQIARLAAGRESI